MSFDSWTVFVQFLLEEFPTLFRMQSKNFHHLYVCVSVCCIVVHVVPSIYMYNVYIYIIYTSSNALFLFAFWETRHGHILNCECMNRIISIRNKKKKTEYKSENKSIDHPITLKQHGKCLKRELLECEIRQAKQLKKRKKSIASKYGTNHWNICELAQHFVLVRKFFHPVERMEAVPFRFSTKI